MDGLVEKACVAYNRVRKGGAVPQDTAMRAAIEAVFDALAEPSEAAVDAGNGALSSTDCAEDTFTAMLATLRKEALG